LNDFYHFKDWDVHLHRQAHSSDLKWLNKQVCSVSQAEPDRRIVIFTHHSPVFGGQAADLKDTKSSFTSEFSTDLSGEECWNNPRAKLWAFGHTHYNCDFKDETTGKRIMTNQRGYYLAQAGGFYKEKVVTV
jgi:hypothetical protein